MPESRDVLEVRGLYAGYGSVGVLHDVGLKVRMGEMVALLGANGAGKSTLLKAVLGFVETGKGDIIFEGKALGKVRPEAQIRRGVSLVPEGRMLFGPMTVLGNLELGAYSAGRGRQRQKAISAGLERAYALFPVLKERAHQVAQTLSGGEQQMLAIARALMCSPRLLVLDEPSLGLAPRVVAEIFSALETLRGEGMTMLIAEQDASLALKHADRGYVMRNGKVILEDAADALLANEHVSAIYLGSLAGEGEGG
ncbi:MAG: ABC transporter ATP-binding protein [Coriobacteriia bacterium]|nr:ABC transporter ATP-binding protein [Coriobacteriia bacterium]